MADPAAAATSGVLTVEVVHALPERQTRLTLSLPAGARVADALAGARRHAAFAAFDPGPDAATGSDAASPLVGIFGRLATPETPLCDGDRVEIYRPLRVDPKQARRRRAEVRGRMAGQRDR